MEIIRYYVVFCDLNIVAFMVWYAFYIAFNKAERNISLAAAFFLIANVLLIWR